MGKLIVNNLNVSYGRNKILKDINLQLECGIYGLLGPNGAGKTTFFKAVTGIEKSKKGIISYDDIDVNSKKYSTKLAYLPQTFVGFSNLTVLEMMDYLATLRNLNQQEKDDRIMVALKQTGLYDNRKKKMSQLSGGMVRRVGIAQCIMGEEDVLIMDEPTAGLDPEERIRFRRILENISSDRTVIVSSHIISDLEDICDKLLIISQGEIAAEISIDELKNIAKNKTYVLQKKSAKMIKGNYSIVNEFKMENEQYINIVSETIQTFPQREATTEDGYLCVIKNY